MEFDFLYVLLFVTLVNLITLRQDRFAIVEVLLHVLVIKCRAVSGSKLPDTLMIFLNEFSKNEADKKACKITQGAKKTHTYKTYVQFTFNYHKGLGRVVHLNVIARSIVTQYQPELFNTIWIKHRVRKF